MTRRRRTPAQREAICRAHGWRCGLCGAPIKPPHDKWALDHIIPLAGGGEDTDDNLHPVHVRCHAGKTLQDVQRIAKGKRVRAKHLGTKTRSQRGFRGWRRFDGSIVFRDDRRSNGA